MIIEVVFIRQGLGFQLIDAITQRDYPVVQGLVMLAAILYAVMNLVVDVLYTYIDPARPAHPRVRIASSPRRRGPGRPTPRYRRT